MKSYQIPQAEWQRGVVLLGGTVHAPQTKDVAGERSTDPQNVHAVSHLEFLFGQANFTRAGINALSTMLSAPTAGIAQRIAAKARPERVALTHQGARISNSAREVFLRAMEVVKGLEKRQ